MLRIMWVELIESVFGTPEDILNNFDFQYLLGSAHTGIRVMAITSVENQRKSYLTLLEIQHLKMMSY